MGKGSDASFALYMQGEVRDMVYTFLNYVINNRVVNQEPVAILQAFQLALVSTFFTFHNFISSLALCAKRCFNSCQICSSFFLKTPFKP